MFNDNQIMTRNAISVPIVFLRQYLALINYAWKYWYLYNTMHLKTVSCSLQSIISFSHQAQGYILAHSCSAQARVLNSCSSPI